MVHLNYIYSIIIIATSIIAPFDEFAWNANTIGKDLHEEAQYIAASVCASQLNNQQYNTFQKRPS